jgi:hypothetical protein
MDESSSYVEERYNDGVQYRLHYMTARELYNVVKAAEAEEPNENPAVYRDYRVQRPSYCTSVNTPEASEELKCLIARTYRD